MDSKNQTAVHKKNHNIGQITNKLEERKYCSLLHFKMARTENWMILTFLM